MDEIYERLTDILRDVFNDNTLVARPGMTAADVAGWDSLAKRGRPGASDSLKAMIGQLYSSSTVPSWEFLGSWRRAVLVFANLTFFVLLARDPRQVLPFAGLLALG